LLSIIRTYIKKVEQIPAKSPIHGGLLFTTKGAKNHEEIVNLRLNHPQFVNNNS
jgi:hypothetical protein